MHVPPGYAMFIPSAIRKAVDLPVVGVGRFKDPLQAERALAEGHCDLVGVVRGQIADADFAAKARAGATEEIRLCLSCNQECVGRMGLNRWLGCIENPAHRPRGPCVRRPVGRRSAGRRVRRGRAPGRAGCRRRSRRPAPATTSPCSSGSRCPAARSGWRRRCPTGPSSATWCATRSTSAGGPASRSPTTRRPRSSVVQGLRPDRVVVATGAVAQRPWWVGPDVTNACDVRDVLTGAAEPSGDVVLIDEIGFHHATSVAELLADRGCAVEVVTPGMVVGQDLGITLDMEQWWMRAGAKGIVQSHRPRADGLRRHHAHAPAPPDRCRRRAHAGLGRAGRAGRARRAAVPRPQGGRRRASSGSATASRRAGPTPPSSRASAPAAGVGMTRRDRRAHWWSARRRVPGLRPLVRRQRRRRHRRPRGPAPAGSATSPRSASTPSGCARPTRRRSGTTATTSPTTSTSTRPTATSTIFDRLVADAARPRAAGHARHGPQPLQRPAPVVPGRAAQRAGQRRAGPLLVPRRARRTVRRNNWPAAFGGSVWTAVGGDDPQWYLATFTPHQPDFDHRHPAVDAMFADALRFWFDRGVDGFRVDAVWPVGKDPALPDCPPLAPGEFNPAPPVPGRGPRGVAALAHASSTTTSTAHPERDVMMIAEAYAPRRPDITAQYTRPDEFQQCFAFDLLLTPWHAAVDAPGDRRGVRARPGPGRVADVHAEQPRHPAHRHPARSRRLGPRRRVDRREPAATRTAPSTSSWAPAGPGPPPACCWRCPVPCTSTRARSSACRSGSTCPTTPARTRCSPTPAAPRRAATAAGSRCRGRPTPAGVARLLADGGPSAAPWLPQPADWGRYAADRQDGDDVVDARAVPAAGRAAPDAPHRRRGRARRRRRRRDRHVARSGARGVQRRPRARRRRRWPPGCGRSLTTDRVRRRRGGTTVPGDTTVWFAP